jgi:hypothetical protein
MMFDRSTFPRLQNHSVMMLWGISGLTLTPLFNLSAASSPRADRARTPRSAESQAPDTTEAVHPDLDTLDVLRVSAIQ